MMFQATVRLHSCCMMTCTLNGGPDIPGDVRGDLEGGRRMPGRPGVPPPGYSGKHPGTLGERIGYSMQWMFLVRCINQPGNAQLKM